MRVILNITSTNYPVFKNNCNAQNLYLTNLAWVINMRFFASCSKLPTVLYELVLVIKNINNLHWFHKGKYAKIREKVCFLLRKQWPFIRFLSHFQTNRARELGLVLNCRWFNVVSWLSWIHPYVIFQWILRICCNLERVIKDKNNEKPY